MHAIVSENYRRTLVRKFSDAIFYEFADGVVMVYCVFHTSQNPDNWRRRLP